MVRLTGVPTKWRRFTRTAETLECVEALSQRSRALVIVASEETASDATGRRPLVDFIHYSLHSTLDFYSNFQIFIIENFIYHLS